MFFILKTMDLYLTLANTFHNLRRLPYQYRQYLAFTLLAALLFSLVPSVLFVHIHHLPDGNTVVHSHFFPPHSKSEQDKKQHQHQHQSSEFLIYSALSVISFSIFLAQAAIYFDNYDTLLLGNDQQIPPTLKIIADFDLRAPPQLNR